MLTRLPIRSVADSVLLSPRQVAIPCRRMFASKQEPSHKQQKREAVSFGAPTISTLDRIAINRDFARALSHALERRFYVINSRKSDGNGLVHSCSPSIASFAECKACRARSRWRSSSEVHPVSMNRK